MSSLGVETIRQEYSHALQLPLTPARSHFSPPFPRNERSRGRVEILGRILGYLTTSASALLCETDDCIRVEYKYRPRRMAFLHFGISFPRYFGLDRRRFRASESISQPFMQYRGLGLKCGHRGVELLPPSSATGVEFPSLCPHWPKLT
jgi:hypothetical protein